MSKTKDMTCVSCNRVATVTLANVFPINDSVYIECPHCTHFNYQPDYERFFND
jgi:hypothetical protein